MSSILYVGRWLLTAQQDDPPGNVLVGLASSECVFILLRYSGRPSQGQAPAKALPGFSFGADPESLEAVMNRGVMGSYGTARRHGTEQRRGRELGVSPANRPQAACSAVNREARKLSLARVALSAAGSDQGSRQSKEARPS